MAAAPAPTVPSLKASFIAAQTNLLSQPLAPSRQWRRTNDASDQPIPARLLDEVLFNLNQTIQQHCRRVYPPQATSNVAEQISSSYLRDASERLRSLKESESSIGRELNFDADDSIEALPTSWPVEVDVTNNPAQAEEYEAVVTRLAELTEQRKQLRLRVQHLRGIEAAVQPLSISSQNNLQDNLVLPDGPLENELEKTRDLLARVADRVAALPERPANHDSGTHSGSTVNLREVANTRKSDIDEFLSSSRVFST